MDTETSVLPRSIDVQQIAVSREGEVRFRDLIFSLGLFPIHPSLANKIAQTFPPFSPSTDPLFTQRFIQAPKFRCTL